MSLHAGAIELLRGDAVLPARLFDALGAIDPKLVDPAAWRLPIVLAAADQKKTERENE
jgi:hypothetical protein